MVVLIVCELLSFIANKVNKLPIESIKKIICDFYSVGQICNAKERLKSKILRILVPDIGDRLYEELAKVVVSDLPRLVTHSQGDTRANMELADLMELWYKADELNIISSLPTFVTASYDKAPAVKPEDLDICLIAKRLFKLEDVVAGHSQTLLDAVDKTTLEWPSLPRNPTPSCVSMSMNNISTNNSDASLTLSASALPSVADQ